MWAVENGMKVNPGKCKAIRLRRDRVKIPLGYSLRDQKFRNLKKRFNLGGQIILRSVKSLEGTSLCNVCPQKGNRNTKSLAHTLLVRPVLEYGAACWDPCPEGHINASDRVQFTDHTKDSE